MKRKLNLLLAATFLVAAGSSLAQSSVASFAGRYTGGTDGASAELTIRPTPNGTSYAIDLAVAGESGCSGAVAGVGSVRGRTLMLEVPNSYNNGYCQITFDHTVGGLAVSEDNCSDFHGLSCSFDGTVSAANAKATRTNAPRSTSDLKSWQFDGYSSSAYIPSDEDNDILLVVSCEAQMDDDDVMSLYIGVRDLSRKTPAVLGSDDVNYRGPLASWSLLIFNSSGNPINTVAIRPGTSALESESFGSFGNSERINLLQFNEAQSDVFESVARASRIIADGNIRYTFSGKGSAAALRRVAC